LLSVEESVMTTLPIDCVHTALLDVKPSLVVTDKDEVLAVKLSVRPRRVILDPEAISEVALMDTFKMFDPDASGTVWKMVPWSNSGTKIRRGFDPSVTPLITVELPVVVDMMAVLMRPLAWIEIEGEDWAEAPFVTGNEKM
jgi:hypothetical protein